MNRNPHALGRSVRLQRPLDAEETELSLSLPGETLYGSGRWNTKGYLAVGVHPALEHCKSWLSDASDQQLTRERKLLGMEPFRHCQSDAIKS
jgi:hypothetical protein